MGSNVVGRAVVVCTLVVGGLVSLLAPASVRAATVTANVFFDRANGPCATTGTGECTLRETVIYANAHPGTTIQLLTGTYALTIGGSLSDDSTTGDLNISANVTMNGSDRLITIISAAQMTSTRGRVFKVETQASARLTRMTIRDGKPLSSFLGNFGGGIMNSGTLQLEDSIVTDNESSDGYGGGIYNSGTLTVLGSTIQRNKTGSLGESGGGIAIQGGQATTANSVVGGVATNGNSARRNGGGIWTRVASVTITNSQIIGNSVDDNTPGSSGGKGGGLFNEGGVTVVSLSDVSSNSASLIGGGIYNNQSYVENTGLTIRQSIIGDNITRDRNGAGGGIANFGPLWLLNNIISRNSTQASGGGVYNSVPGNATLQGNIIRDNSSGGGGITSNATISLNNDRILHNIAAYSGGGVQNSSSFSAVGVSISENRAQTAGGIINQSNATLDKSTIARNEATTSDGGIVNVQDLTLTNSTISTNVDPIGGGLNSLYVSSRSTLTNVTIAANRSGIYGPGFVIIKNSLLVNTGPNCASPVTSGDYNLSSDTTCPSFTQPHDLTNTDPLLSALANNGGPTPTHALLQGSPAIDAGGTSANGCPATDQRGVVRPQGAACDIGAYEATPFPNPLPPPRPAAPTIGDPAPQPPPRPGAPETGGSNPAPPQRISNAGTMPAAVPPPAPPLPNPLPPRR